MHARATKRKKRIRNQAHRIWNKKKMKGSAGSEQEKRHCFGRRTDLSKRGHDDVIVTHVRKRREMVTRTVNSFNPKTRSQERHQPGNYDGSKSFSMAAP